MNYLKLNNTLFQKLLLSAFFIIFTQVSAFATHIRAGEITAQRISASSFNYEITLTIYANTSAFFRDTATIYASDGWSQNVGYLDTLRVSPSSWRVRYRTTHIFQGSGIYYVRYRDVNRVEGVLNLSNSGNTAFFLETMLLLDAGLGLNNTPQLLVPPIDDGAVGQIYTYNPGAFDADGDSLAYKMDIPYDDEQVTVSGYLNPGTAQFSMGSIFMRLDSTNGNLEWNMPKVPGMYNIAYRIYEWRNGLMMSYIHRDMQINIIDTDNDKPIITLPNDSCVVALEPLTIGVFAEDPDNDNIDLSIFTGVIPPAIFTDSDLSNPAIGVFEWTPTCADVREEPFQVIFKADDAPSRDPSLVDIQTLSLKVNGPEIDGFTIKDTTDGNKHGVVLEWDTYLCASNANIHIFRKKCESLQTLDSCLENTLEELGYTLISILPGSDTRFVDFGENTLGLASSQEYCYRLQAIFPAPKNGKGIPSDQKCHILGKELPFIYEVSVLNTDRANGQISIKWSAPIDSASNANFDPTKVNLYRGFGLNPTSYQNLGNFPLLETIDAGLNTQDSIFTYKLEYLGKESSSASSVFLSSFSQSGQINLAWEYNVPWNNLSNFHRIYFVNKSTSTTFSVLDSVFPMQEIDQIYSHLNLLNGDTLCYYVETQGSYCNNKAPFILFNNSQEVCQVPKDETPPCKPIFEVIYDCQIKNPYLAQILTKAKVNPDAFCFDDVDKFNVYYTRYKGDTFNLLYTYSDTLYDYKDFSTVIGCYYAKAIDFAGNESESSDTVCIDNDESCLNYILPNIITPNGDEHNNIFVPIPPTSYVRKVHFEAFNRWGRRVFSTDDININWSPKDIPDGLYYYNADVEFERLNRADEQQKIKGWIQILR